MNQKRIKALQKNIAQPLLVVKKENLFYFTGQHFIDGYLLISKKDIIFLGNGLEQVKGIRSDFIFNIKKYVKTKQLLVEDVLPVADWNYLTNKLPGIKMVPASGKVEQLRELKEKVELEQLDLAYQITAKVFETVKSQLKKKQWTEAGLARYIRIWGLELGADEVSFDPIVAGGKNSAIPHHRPGENILKAGQSIVLDFGFKVNGYCSDFTRTVFLRSVPSKMKPVYEAVEQAYNLVIQNLHSGMAGKTADELARNYLTKAGYGDLFIHSLGHGTGLEVHEQPSLSPSASSTLENGSVFSVEPGVYLPGAGGVRIEDLVYLYKDKPNYFVEVPTDLKSNTI